MQIRKLIVFIFFISCESKNVILTSEVSPFHKLVYYNKHNTIYKEAICDEEIGLIKLIKNHLDTITEFDFISYDTFTVNHGDYEAIMVKKKYSKNIIYKGSIISSSLALDEDSINPCICVNACK